MSDEGLSHEALVGGIAEALAWTQRGAHLIEGRFLHVTAGDEVIVETTSR